MGTGGPAGSSGGPSGAVVTVDTRELLHATAGGGRTVGWPCPTVLLLPALGGGATGGPIGLCPHVTLQASLLLCWCFSSFGSIFFLLLKEKNISLSIWGPRVGVEAKALCRPCPAGCSRPLWEPRGRDPT